MSQEGETPDDRTRIERIKQHLKDNKKEYLIGAGCLTAGYLLRGRSLPLKSTKNLPVLAPVINNTPLIAPVMNNIVHNTVNNGGAMRKIVQCLETGEIWEKVTDAAEAAGTSLSYMSRHINGHKPDVFGRHYKIIGLGTD